MAKVNWDDFSPIDAPAGQSPASVDWDQFEPVKQDRSYLGAAAESGGRSVLAAGARLLESLNPFTTSDAEAAVLFKDDPEGYKQFVEKGAASALSRFANEQTERAKQVMKDVRPGETGAISGKPLGELEYATTDPEKAAYLSPTRVAGDVLQSLPTTMALAVSAYLTKGRALTVEKELLAKGATQAEARAAAIQAGAETMAKTGAAGEGAIGYAQQYNQTLNEAKDKDFSQSPEYAQLLEEGYTPETAKAALSSKVAQESGLIAGAVDAGTNLVGGKVLGKIIGEGGSLVPRIGKGFVTEAATETVQSGGEQFGSNLAMQRIDPSQSLSEGVGEAMVAGGVVGGVTGGGVSALFGSPKRSTDQVLDSLGAAQDATSAAKAASELSGNLDELTSAVDQYLAQGVPNQGTIVPNQGTPLTPQETLELAASKRAIRDVGSLDLSAPQTVGTPAQTMDAATAALREVEKTNGVATPAQAAIIDAAFPGRQMYDRVEGAAPAAAPVASSAIITEPASNLRSRTTYPNPVDQANAESWAEQQARAAAAQPAADLSTPAAPTPPAASSVMSALTQPAALRTAEQKITIDAAQRTYAPEDFQILQLGATAPFQLDSQQRMRLQSLRAEASAATTEATQATPKMSTGRVSIAQAAAVPEGTISEVDPTTLRDVAENGELDQNNYRLINQVGRVFGKRVVLFDGDMSDGFVNPDLDPDTIYINRNSTVAHLAVFGHELLHTLRKDSPDTYRSLATVVARNLDKTGRAAFREDYGSNATVEELTADLVGNRFRDPDFWVQTFNEIAGAQNEVQSRGVVAQLAGALYSAVDRAIKALRGQGFRADAYVKDLEQVKAAARQALKTYAQERKIPAMQLEAQIAKAKVMADNVSVANQGAQNARINDAAGTGSLQSPARQDRPELAGDRGDQVPEYGTARDGAISVQGVHYSRDNRPSLDSRYYGSGLKGEELQRIQRSNDARLRQRIYLYANTGRGINPEEGVGSYPHAVRLNNIYDPSSRLIAPQADANAFESAVIDAGFDGYLNRSFGAVVLLGQRTVPVVPSNGTAPVVEQAQQNNSVAARLQGLRSLPAGELSRQRWGQVLKTTAPDVYAELEPTGAFEGEDKVFKDGLVKMSKKRGAVAENIEDISSIENAFARAREGSFNTNRELKVFLQNAVQTAANQNDLTRAKPYLVKVGVKDALYALDSNANAVGWYDTTVTKAMNILATLHPEIATDPNAKFAFTWALAVTSNGLKVDKNFELAERAYRDYKATGRMPTNIQAGQAQKAINESMALFNDMVEKYGIENMRKFMSDKFKVSQIERVTGVKVTGEFKDTEVRGAAILGPKIGNGFFSNLNGFFDQLTMDRWLMRTWGRWTGTLIEARPDMVKQKREELGALVREIKKNPKATLEFEKALGRKLTVSNLDELALAIQKASMKPELRAEFNKTEVGENIRKTGNGLAKYLDGQKEAPAGPEERNFIREVFGEILQDVRQQGYEALTMSDLQALLWYPEKRLYDVAKSDEATEGYEDDEAPDYANAAAKLARDNGVSEEEIKNAADVSTAGAERGTGNDEAQARVEGRDAGFAQQERRAFLLRGVLESYRGSDGASQPYSRRSSEGARRLRVLGQEAVAQYSPATKFKNALGAADAPAPKFFELDAKGAALFSDSIKAAKDASVYGAAVYVYPEEDYRDMRLFLTEDGKSGFALKGDDIVSVFSGEKGASTAMLQLAVQEGGRRLDAFDTVLTNIYATNGFRAVARLAWNDEYRPDDWNKATFKLFNGGEPDVVFMVYDPKNAAARGGEEVSSYEAGIDAQRAALGTETATEMGEVEYTDAGAADVGVKFSTRRKPAPEKTVKAYKLFRMDKRKPGQLFPLFVNANDAVPMNEWLDADEGPMQGGKVKSKLGPLAYRPGWHAGDLPLATHIGGKSSNDLKAPDIRPENHVWAEVEMAADRDWQSVANERARRNKSGEIIPNTAHITDQIPEDGFYRYKTNANMTGNWLIGGSMKVTRILSDDEVKAINAEAGTADLPRATPLDLKAYGFDAAAPKLSTPRFYSQLERTIEQVPERLSTQPAAQWKAWLAANASKYGIKKEEIEWSGVNDYLTLRGKDKVTAAELGAFLDLNNVKIEEITKGGEPQIDYSEIEVLPVPSPLQVGRNDDDRLQQYKYAVTTVMDGRYLGYGNTEQEALSDAYSAYPEYWNDMNDVDAPKYAQWVLPGGENYREMLLTLPGVDTDYRSAHWDEANILAHIRLNDRTDVNGDKVLFVEEIQSDWAQAGRKRGFDTVAPAPETAAKTEYDAYVATLKDRYVDWYDKEFADEISSQERRRQLAASQADSMSARQLARGIDDTDTFDRLALASVQETSRNTAAEKASKTGVPAGPFIANTKDWVALAVKRVMLLAAQGDYSKVAFVNGEQSADRYNLAKQVSKIDYFNNEDGTYELTVYPIGGAQRSLDDLTASQLEDYVGKEIASRIVNGEGTKRKSGVTELYGIDLVTGGEGMMAFYNRIVPQVVGDVLKKLGGKLETVNVRSFELNDDMDEVQTTPAQPGFTVTPEMREKLKGDGLPLFSKKRAQTETAAFQQWFADSNVVDANGEPLMVYHGTGDIVTAFDLDHPNRKDTGWLGTGVYITDDAELAAGYANQKVRSVKGKGQNVMPLYARITNPYYATLEEKEAMRSRGRAGADMFTAELKAKGHDGVILDLGDGTREMVVFDPAGVKSASGNVGTFDASNPDIRYSNRRAFGELNAQQEQALSNVGGLPLEATIRQRLMALRDSFAGSWRQGLFDQFAPLKALSQEAYMLARLSKGSDGTLEAAMMYGRPYLNKDGIPDVNINDRGFAKTLATLKGEHDRFLWWVSAQRAERLKALGLENLFTDADISSLKTLDQGQFADGTDRAPVYAKALEDLNSFNDSVLELAEKSGLIDPQARIMFKNAPYVPFYRVMDGNMTGPKFSSGLVNQTAWKRLKGGSAQLNSDLLANVLMNWSHLYTAAANNRAARASLEAGSRIGIAEVVPSGTKGAVKVMDKGQAVHYLISDPYVQEAVTALEYVAPSFFKPFSMFKRWLTIAVTANPAFKIRNLIRDSLSAIGTAELSYNPVANVTSGFKATSKGTQTYASMLAGGGVIRFGTMVDGDRAHHARRLVEREGGVMLDAKGWDKLSEQMRTVITAYNELGDRMENVNRAALYEQLIKQGYSTTEANFMARDLMDFSMSGRWPVVRFLAQVVPFMNARLQGLYKLGRAAKDNPARFGYVVGAVALASIALMLAYEDDEDWKKRPDWDRDSNWWFKIGDTAFRIPKPFEIGALGTLAERTLELFISKEMTGKRYRERLSNMIFDTFAMDPTPQIVKPLLDVYANKAGFTGKPIETMGQEKLRPQDRVNANTSNVAKFLGQLGMPDPAMLAKGEYKALSPVQVDYLIRGYFGWLGTSAVTMIDYGIRPMLNKGERPDMRLKDAFLVGNFVESLPSGSSRYVDQMYSQAAEIEQAYQSWRDALKKGDGAGAKAIFEAEKAKIVKYKQAENIKDRVQDINKRIKLIEASKTLSGETKRKMMDQLEQQKDKAARFFQPLR